MIWATSKDNIVLDIDINDDPGPVSLGSLRICSVCASKYDTYSGYDYCRYAVNNKNHADNKAFMKVLVTAVQKLVLKETACNIIGVKGRVETPLTDLI